MTLESKTFTCYVRVVANLPHKDRVKAAGLDLNKINKRERNAELGSGKWVSHWQIGFLMALKFHQTEIGDAEEDEGAQSLFRKPTNHEFDAFQTHNKP